MKIILLFASVFPGTLVGCYSLCAGTAVLGAFALDANAASSHSNRFAGPNVRNHAQPNSTVSPPLRTVTEEFESNPQEHGWQLFGDADLIQWNATGKNLEVTWDSSRPNTYFALPLGTILTRQDDFSVSLNLLLDDIDAGVSASRPGTFQIAFGFQNSGDARKTNFFRGSANNSPNLVEFDFFPDTGFGPTVWPGILSTNSAMNYNGAGDFSIFDLPTDTLLHISLAYVASNETATITVTANDALVGPVTSARLATNNVGFGAVFTQFNVDTFAIASYSDEGQNPAFAGSILAHGVIDNIVLSVPPLPVQQIHGVFKGTVWQVTFLSRPNWNYVLESTQDLRVWATVAATSGTGTDLVLEDRDADATNTRFYRVNAQRAE